MTRIPLRRAKLSDFHCDVRDCVCHYAGPIIYHGKAGRSWWFMVIPPVFEVFEFAFRIPSVQSPTNTVWYLLSQFILLIAPQISAAMTYIVMGALVLAGYRQVTMPSACQIRLGI